MQKLYTPEEVAAVLKVKPRTVMEWLRKGKLKGVKIGGKLWRIKESDLQTFIEQGWAMEKVKGEKS